MRKALNENPLVQAALIGLLGLAVGVMVIMRMGGGADSSAEADPAASTADPAATMPTTAADPAAAVPATPADAATATAPAAEAAVDPATGAATFTPPALAAGGDLGSFEAGPGLPREVVDAYRDGKAVVLLVVRHSGIDDRKVEAMVSALRSDSETAVFVTRAAGIARYSRITQGLDVNRTPALVVIRPQDRAEGGPPVATVAYGFQGPASVRQAVDDALYKGPANLPYYP